MIEIKFDADKLKLTVKGHAEYAEKGQDIVCAGVSALVGALAITLSDMWEGNSMMKKPITRLKEGNTLIQAYAKPEYKKTLSLVFYPILEGLDLIARKYPENVSMVG